MPQHITDIYNIRRWTQGFQTNSQFGLQLAVGYENSIIYNSYVVKYQKFLANLDMTDAWNNPNKFIDFIENSQADGLKLLVVKRLAILNLNKIDIDDRANLFKTVCKIYDDKIINKDAMQLALKTWRINYNDIFVTQSNDLFIRSMQNAFDKVRNRRK